jgi:integrase
MSDRSKFSLFKRSNGFYYILFEEDGRKRWKSTRCRTKPDAFKALTQFRELFRERLTPKSLSAFTQEFLSYAHTSYKRATVEIYERALDLLKKFSDDVTLSALSPKHIDMYKMERLRSIVSFTAGTKAERTISPTTVNMELRALRAAMRVAVRWRLLEKNPFDVAQFASVPEIPPTFLTKEDFQKLITLVVEGWLKEIIIFAVLTGMRRGEIINLRWQDVDLQRRLIHIQSNPTFRTKQGRQRVVPMNNVVFNLLSAKAGRSCSLYVFDKNGKRILGDHACKKFKHYIRESNLPEGLHFHSLRHTFASWLVQKGVSLYEVQKLLGHSNIQVTQRYSHLQPEHLHATVNEIEVSLN